MTGDLRTIALQCVAIAAILALAACGSAPLPSPDPTSTPKATVATVAPEPEQPDVASRPADRVPLSCDELIDEDARALAMGALKSTISLKTSSVSNGMISFLQGGMLTCQWESSKAVKVEGSSSELRLEILPDAADEFQAMAASFPTDGFTTGLIGPDSLVSCIGEVSKRSCTMRFENDGYWVELSFNGHTTLAAADPSLADDAVQIGTAVRDALAAAGPPRPAFVPAADAATGWDDCADVDGSEAFRRELSSPSFVAPEGYWAGASMFSVAMVRAGFTTCVWRHNDVYSTPAGELRQVGIEMIPGAAWAWPDLVADALAKNPAAEISVAGAEAAVLVCWDANECTAQALVRGSYVAANASNEQRNTADARSGAIRALELAIAAL